MRTPLLALALAASSAAIAQTTPPSPAAPPAGGMGMGMGMRGMGGLMRADANGDGVVTRDEAIAAADAEFDRMDANHDGKVTSDERQAAFQAMRGGAGGQGGGGSWRGGAGMRGMGGDTTVTKADFRARQLARFDRADTNHDGSVDQAEMDAMRQMRMQRRDDGEAAPQAGQP